MLRSVRPDQFVTFIQNHDQIGNRLAGERLSSLVSFDKLKLAAACTLLGPYIPLVFMGEEYGEEAPFPFFVSHSDEDLVSAVRAGRKAEFASFGWTLEPPDPQSPATFASARVASAHDATPSQRTLAQLYRDLIALRHATPLIASFDHLDVENDAHTLALTRRGSDAAILLVANFDDTERTAPANGRWTVLIATDDPRYSTEAHVPARAATVQGSIVLAPHSAVLLRREPA
jgi:maltooligosyltrehalose trehalohydrolase